MQVWFPGAVRDFSSRVNFQCRLSYGVRTPPSAITCIYSCALVKDPVVHVRVWWIMETLKHPTCTLGWVAWLCCSWLSPGKATWIFHGRIPIGTMQLLKKKKWLPATLTAALQLWGFNSRSLSYVTLPSKTSHIGYCREFHSEKLGWENLFRIQRYYSSYHLKCLKLS